MRVTTAMAILTLCTCAAVAGLGDLSPDKAALLQAWKQVQRDDPQTVLFEEIEPGRYSFETERFPYSGELRVLNVSLHEQAFGGDGVMRTGAVEVELVDLPEGFHERHSYSYGFWLQTHLLYAQDDGPWMSSGAWQEHAAGGFDSWCSPFVDFFDWFWIGALVLLLVALSFAVRKADRQMKKAMSAQDQALSDQERVIRLSERALELSEDSNQVLREILRAIERRDSPS